MEDLINLFNVVLNEVESLRNIITTEELFELIHYDYEYYFDNKK